MRRLALIVLVLFGVLFFGQVRLHDSGRLGKKPTRRLPDVVPAKQGADERPLKFVDPPMPAVPPGPTPRERDRRQ